MMYLNVKNTLAALLIVFTFNHTMSAQELTDLNITDNLKIWSGLNLSYNVTNNVKLKMGQIFSLNTYPLEYSFSQTRLSLSFKIKRRTYIEGGFVKGFYHYSSYLENQGASPGWFNTLAVDRVFGRFSYKHDLIARFSLNHKLEFQYFLPELNKYKTRILYSVRLGYNVRRSSLTPYIRSRFYYYQGGAILNNGIKRLRCTAGLSFRPAKNSSIRVSIYYLFQNELNTQQLSDNDYAVIGSSISFKLK